MRKVYNIKSFRRDFAIRQQEMAALLKCSQSYVSYLERGERDILPAEEKILIDKYGKEVMDKYVILIEANATPNAPSQNDALIETLTSTIESQQRTIEKQQQTITHLLNIISGTNDQHQRV